MGRAWTGMALVSGLVVGTSLAFGQAEPAAPAPEPAAAADQSAAQPAGGINLDLDGTGAEEAFDQLAKQAGIDLIVNDQQLWFNADPVFIKVKNGRFWPTFMEMVKQARVNFNPDFGSNRPRSIQLYNGGGGMNNDISKLPQSESQGCLIIAQSANRSAYVQYDRPENTNSNFSIQLRVFIDPSMNVMQMGQPTVSEAVDENGLSIVGPRNSGGTYYGNNMGSLIQNVGVPLAYPPKIGKKIAKIKGTLRMTTVVKMETIEMESPLSSQAVKKELPDYDITLQPMKVTKEASGNEGARYEMKVTIRTKQRENRGGIRRDFRNDLSNMLNSIVVTDADGHRLNNNGWGGGGSSIPDTVEYNMNYQSWPNSGVGQPAKVSWKVPVETKEIRVPFELKDLVIP